MKQLIINLKINLLKGLVWVLNNAYEIALTVACFLVLIELIPVLSLAAVLFGSFVVWGLKKQGVIKPIKLNK